MVPLLIHFSSFIYYHIFNNSALPFYFG
jgi:hypothetical protein